MPEIKNNFIQGKMNKDLDERLIPKGEYREAQNIIIGESDDSDVGAIEVIKGNVKKAAGLGPQLSQDPEVIGYCRDVKNKKIYYFITNFSGNSTDNIRNISRTQGAGTSSYSSTSTDDCRIIEYDIETETNTVLVAGPFLNFSKNHLITGAQVIDDLLFFTDNYNQPRKINVARAKADSSYYSNEDQISIAKYAPYQAIRLVNKHGVWAESNTAGAPGSGYQGISAADITDVNIKSDYMLENFLRFSYRYKYDDGEYSVFAPFTQIVFEPLNDAVMLRQEDQRNTTANEPDVPTSVQDAFQKTTVDIMRNAINKAILRIPLPNANERGFTSDNFSTYSNDYKIREVQIVLKESNSRAIKVVKNITISNEDGSLDSNLVDNLDSYGIKPKNAGNTTYYRQVLKYVYRSEKPFQVLPEDQTTRVYDQTPLQAKALDIVGNRVVFGNFVENYEFPKDEQGQKGMNYYIGAQAKGDARYNTTFGVKEYNFRAYPHHNIKQRRTYQVGVVFADKFGRQSPVILSSFKPTSTNQITDTFTVQPDVVDRYKGLEVASGTLQPGNQTGSSITVTGDLSEVTAGMYIEMASNPGSGLLYQGTKITSISGSGSGPYTIGLDVAIPYNQSGNIKVYQNNEGSWSTNQVAHGQALTMSWQDSTLFSTVSKGIYNGVVGPDYNPHGWYSYRIVVKQTEQDYYNVYANHPANSWSNTGVTKTTTTSNLPSSTTELTQTITGQQDLGSGGRTWLTLHGDNINKVPRNPSEQDFERDGVMGSEVKLYPKVVAIDGSGPSRMGSAAQEYLDVISIGTAREQGLFNENATVQESTSSQQGGGGTNDLVGNKFRVYNFVYGKDKNPLVAELPNLNEEPVDVNSIDVSVPSGSSANDNKDTDTPFGFPNDPNIGFGNTPQFRSQGLTVFETKPFESLIDIFYETSTTGLVQDLEDQLASNNLAGGPSNVQLNASSFPESSQVGANLATVSATDNTGSGNNLSYTLANAYSGSTNVTGSFAVSSSGVITLQGEFLHKDNSEDDIQLQFYVNDPDTGTITSPQLQLSVTNSVPVVPNNQSVSVSINGGANQVMNIVGGSAITNGSAKATEDHVGLTATHNFGNSGFNQYFSSSMSGNALTFKTTSAWTTNAAQAIFFAGQASNSDRTATISISDGHSTSTFNVQVVDNDPSVSGDLEKSNAVNCEACQTDVDTYYAIRNGASNSQPYVTDGDLFLFTGNKVYQNASLTTTAADGKYMTYKGGTTQEMWCYTLVSGVVTNRTTSDVCDASD